MRSSLFIVIIALGTMIWACKNNSSNPVTTVPPAPNYYPLAIGDVWNYTSYYTDANGVKQTGTDGTEKDSVIAIDTVGGQAAFAVKIIMNDTISSIAYFAFDANGNLQVFTDTTGNLQGYWKQFAWVGDTTTTVHTDSAVAVLSLKSQTGSITMHGTQTEVQTFGGDSAVTVGAGTFFAHEYRDSLQYTYSNTPYGPIYGSSATTSFFANNVGRIQSVAKVAFTGALQVNSNKYEQLASYHLVN